MSEIERELGWDDEISRESDFTLIPEGDYRFTVTAVERARHEGNAKLPPCRKAIVSLELRLIHRARSKNYIAVMIDPIYKVITGDENSATEMAHFCNQFDKICTELGCSVIYCHHHSKGAQGAKRSMDRASGSGVFARDPYALLDLIELDIPDALRNEWTEQRSAWRVEGTLREYPFFRPVNAWFEHPLHLPDLSGELSDLEARDAVSRRQNFSRKRTAAQRKSTRTEIIENVFKVCSPDGREVALSELAEYLGMTEKTVRTHLKEHGGFYIYAGRTGKKTT